MIVYFDSCCVQCFKQKNMETIKYLIVDDEPLPHQALRILLKNYEQMQCIGNCYNAFKALAFIKENKPDLIFLDMDMPDMNGMELLKNINQPIKVIITTGHSDYAIQGYEFGVVDFLLKPIKAERLYKTMTRVFESFTSFNEIRNEENSDSENDKRVYVFGTDIKNKVKKIFLDEILYIQKNGNYLDIHSCNGEVLQYMNSLKTIIRILPEEDFSYANQSVIISKKNVKSIEEKNVVINDKIVIKVSPGYLKKQGKMQKG